MLYKTRKEICECNYITTSNVMTTSHTTQLINDHCDSECSHQTFQIDAVFCPGYSEWWLNSKLHLVLFTQYILNTISVAILSERWLRGGYSRPVWAEHCRWDAITTQSCPSIVHATYTQFKESITVLFCISNVLYLQVMQHYLSMS